MTAFSNWIDSLSGWVWGLYTVAILMGVGLFCAILSRGVAFRGFLHAIRLVSGRFSHESDREAEGSITYFQGLMNAMASTVGLGNISGVALAIVSGGPGAVFWMWIAALIGMNTRFFETTMAMAFRGHDYHGQAQGGTMYVLQSQAPSLLKWTAVLFALCGLIGTLGAFQANQITLLLHDRTGLPQWILGITLTTLVIIVLSGGLPALVRVTSSLVPTMCLLYVGAACFILVRNASAIPEVFSQIFHQAFSLQSAGGGVSGAVLANVITQGVRRGTFSNEAGLGTAPLAHADVKTAEPVAEGLVAMLGPFFDTIVICTMTALVILTSLPPENQDVSGIILTMNAFSAGIPSAGSVILTLVAFLFAFTTIIGVANYNRKCWNFLFKGRRFLQEKSFILYFSATVFLASCVEMKIVIDIIDIAYGLMIFPNLLAVLMTAPEMSRLLGSYFRQYIK